MARTRDIGLRRDPHPPMPRVIPSRSSATTSASVICLSGKVGLLRRIGASPLDERLPRLVCDTREVQLIGKALLVPVAAMDVNWVDAVQRLLRSPDHFGAF